MIKINTTYRIYGKMGDMERFQALSGDSFTTNLICADLFTPTSSEDVAILQRELDFLNTQGEFELREVK